MTTRIIPCIVFLFLSFLNGEAQDNLVTNGIKISKTTNFKKAVYKKDGVEALNKAVALIEGNDLTIDFKNSLFKGSNAKNEPDAFFGLALLIQNSKRVTIRNLKVQGYKVALMARNVEELTLDNCDFSYNYRQHLNSTQEKEDISDWMSYHHNEKDEWLRYGAAIYLRGCHKTVIKNCKVTGGQNALMMMECNDGMIYNNDFSFNSGIGIGMYRCNRNKVMYNKLVFNVRGYSDGVYNRGQDSAGILVYEQSSDNLFYKNNVTHSGDGFFLWAGQTTMDNGQGGCNDNIIRGNDFSYAPTNGVEVTFSRNTIVDNRIFECDNGIWGGYSYESIISNNKFRNNKTAIAIEHGRQNKVTYNIFYHDIKAIHLWGRAGQPAGWGYAKYRNTQSGLYTIAFNNFNSNGIVFDLKRTDTLNVFNNIYQDYEHLFILDSTVNALDTTINEDMAVALSADTSSAGVPVLTDPVSNPFKNSGSLAGRKNIFITEWGPYDFRSPVIWNRNPADSGSIMIFELKGPPGKWKIKSFRGLDSFSLMKGTFPETITAKKIKGQRTDIYVELEYSGASITTPMGVSWPKDKPYIFKFRKFFQPVDWKVSWFSLDTAVFNPIRENQLFAPNVRVQPVKTETADRIDYALWDGIKTKEGSFPGFITMAEGAADFPKGSYDLSVTWDDAVRVYVDNKLVIDEWNPSYYQFDESPNRKVRLNLDGHHDFRVEHVNLGGFAVLSLKFNPAF